MRVPRTLFLSYSPPDGSYTVIRRIVDLFPPGAICWASTLPCSGDEPFDFPHRAFVPAKLHWRIHRGSLQYLYENELQARAQSEDVVAWARPFEPEVIWSLAELGAAHLGCFVARELAVPMHAMVQDAHETALHILPRLYYSIYNRSVRRFLRSATTVDAICRELLDWTVGRYGNLQCYENASMVFHPSISRGIAENVPEPVCFDEQSRLRRIGLCGSMRVTREQWAAFVRMLGALPFDFEIMAHVYRGSFHEVPLPSNVTISLQPFAPSEADIIRGFHSNGVSACYLGLWKEPKRNLFSRTSLSAKLTTYLAARLPVIVDGPENASAWRLVGGSGAGVLCGHDTAAALEGMTALFNNVDLWQSMSAAAGTLCREQFDLERNTAEFQRLLARCAGTDEEDALR